MYSYNDIRQVHLEVTQRCQAACPMCDRNESGGRDNRHITNAELSLDDAKAIFTPDFIKQLDNAYAVVNHSSNPAMQAVFNGVPVFTSPSSLSYDVANKDYSKLQSPDTPDRDEWAHRLCHTEWWLDEIKEGKPWERIRNRILEEYTNAS